MKSLNPRITRLKELMELEERRADLQEQLESLINRMSALKDALFDDSTSPARATSTPVQSSGTGSGASTSGRRIRRGRMPRGELKSQLLSALTTAGSNGVRVTELARTLGLNPVNVHSWFHSASRRYPQIKKIDRGQYRLEGAIKDESSSPSNGSAKAAPKAGRRRNGGRSTAPHSRRGELSKRILSELTDAGAKGITVRDLASKIGAPYKNIYIWFATTGKKNGKVKKVAPATYKLAA
jgi:hypothetical protein